MSFRQKINNLKQIMQLSDDDLFMIVRDENNDGQYDKAYKIKFSNLSRITKEIELKPEIYLLNEEGEQITTESNNPIELE